jgi:hypothetical protein
LQQLASPAATICDNDAPKKKRPLSQTLSIPNIGMLLWLPHNDCPAFPTNEYYHTSYGISITFPSFEMKITLLFLTTIEGKWENAIVAMAICFITVV